MTTESPVINYHIMPEARYSRSEGLARPPGSQSSQGRPLGTGCLSDFGRISPAATPPSLQSFSP
jgi:hypothetical protein